MKICPTYLVRKGEYRLLFVGEENYGLLRLHSQSKADCMEVTVVRVLSPDMQATNLEPKTW